MAVTLPKKALRALQDALSVHKAVFSEYASVSTSPRPHSAHHHPYGQESCHLVEVLRGDYGLVGMLTIHHKTSLEVIVLVQRWRVASELPGPRYDPEFDSDTSVGDGS
jgi:hypothetical protein